MIKRFSPHREATLCHDAMMNTMNQMALALHRIDIPGAEAGGFPSYFDLVGMEQQLSAMLGKRSTCTRLRN